MKTMNYFKIACLVCMAFILSCSSELDEVVTSSKDENKDIKRYSYRTYEEAFKIAEESIALLDEVNETRSTSGRRIKDSLYIGTVGSGIRLSQLVAFICVVLSVFFIVLLMIKAKSNGVTSLYTKLPNGKWIMTDAIQQISEEAEKEASDENEDGGDIREESTCGDENNEEASLDDEDIEDESAEDASSDEEAEKTEDSEVTKDETEKTEGEN